MSSSSQIATLFPKRIAPKKWRGRSNGVEVIWSSDAQKWLLETAVQYGQTQEALKASTEHFAILLTEHLGQQRCIIRGSFHPTTTNKGVKREDACHCTVSIGGESCHIYVNLEAGMDIKDLEVLDRTICKRTPEGKPQIVSIGP